MGTWYPSKVYNIIGLKYYLHSHFQKSLMERVNQYFKDRTESFDDYSIMYSKRKKVNTIYYM